MCEKNPQRIIRVYVGELFLYTKVCKKSRQWQDFCIVMHSEEAVGGRYCRYINITGEENGKWEKAKKKNDRHISLIIKHCWH